MIENVLKELGLTDSEVKVYLTLLELGDSTRTNIVNKSKIAGSKVYDILEKLKQKGLVTIYIKDKIKHFKPVSPKQILNYIEDKKDSIVSMKQQAENILPQLLLMFNSSKADEEVELYEGLKGLQAIFYEQIEIMKPDETAYVIGGTRGSDEEHVMAFFQKIHDLRAKKKIITKMLYNKRQKANTEKLFNSYKYTTTRYIDHTSPVAINIYKNRTVIIIFGKKITAIHIKSIDVANSFMEYFNILWRQSVK
jgi:sugar-specific transcriptional regulator TrmB